MNRQIKFRVWDTKNNEWCLGDDLITHERDEFISLEEIATQSTVGIIDNDDELATGLVWQQFTGLLDKNGREIYDGDILKYLRSEPNKIGVVSFERGAFVYSACVNGRGPIALWAFTVENGNIIALEVIGNIFEHPQLVVDSERKNG